MFWLLSASLPPAIKRFHSQASKNVLPDTVMSSACCHFYVHATQIIVGNQELGVQPVI